MNFLLDNLAWVGVALCICQSAMFSGLNLAFFGVSRLRLEAEAANDPRAARVLAMRKDSNFLLTTILWGNVGTNVLLTLFTDSVLTGVSAFFVSTFLITFFGEIAPQAYFSRNALRMAALLAPVIRVYQFLLYPFARPSAHALDLWLGKESAQYMQEDLLREMLIRHVHSEHTEVDEVEGIGALNFLDIDDLTAWDEGETLAPASIIMLPADVDLPRIPEVLRSVDDPFLRQVDAAGEKWVVLVNEENEPLLVLDADEFIRAALLSDRPLNGYEHCHRPVVVRSERRSLGWVIKKLAQGKKRGDSGVIEDDVVLVWGPEPKIITGADILGRLLTGIGESSAAKKLIS